MNKEEMAGFAHLTEERGKRVECLVCCKCETAIVSPDDLVDELPPALGACVYRYELEVMRKRELPAYLVSDANNECRFDLIRAHCALSNSLTTRNELGSLCVKISLQ